MAPGEAAYLTAEVVEAAMRGDVEALESLIGEPQRRASRAAFFLVGKVGYNKACAAAAAAGQLAALQALARYNEEGYAATAVTWLGLPVVSFVHLCLRVFHSCHATSFRCSHQQRLSEPSVPTTTHDPGCGGQAARNGHLPLLQWARANGFPWDKRVIQYARDRGHADVVAYARAHGAPEPPEPHGAPALPAPAAAARAVLGEKKNANDGGAGGDFGALAFKGTQPMQGTQLAEGGGGGGGGRGGGGGGVKRGGAAAGRAAGGGAAGGKRITSGGRVGAIVRQAAAAPVDAKTAHNGGAAAAAAAAAVDVRGELTQWRKRVSANMNQPAYLVFNNETLQAIVDAAPASLNELLQVKVRAELYHCRNQSS
jgi:hypothetical protein